MNSHAILRRSTAHLVVGAHRRIHSREVANKYYELAEREQQFQFPISGSLAIVPSEYTFKILFDHFFIFDYGTLRDSQLNEPFTRFGFSQVSAPAGTHFYAHVTSWLQDPDLHFEGCYLTVGAYNPVISGEQALQAAIKFAATLHCSFHGFGAPIDDNESANSALTPSQEPPTP